ncbi:hypothetical protein EU527_02540 [Candidatus Thorarchaeota archaeon]|nr:MAG: hypothetical protein EU527_02540 [Candidatus Thorarchaeota archaeon]
MRQNQLTLVTGKSVTIDNSLMFSDTLTESLWDTVKNHTLHIILREPALLELARRKDPGVIAFCDILINSEDQESWFSALKALETLNTYDAAQRLLVLGGSSSTTDRKIVLGVLARILTSSHRENFRRLIRSIISPGELDVSEWSPIALRMLEFVCSEKGIDLVYPPLSDYQIQLMTAEQESVESK